MSILIVRRALEKRLATMSPAIATAYENAGYTPVAGTPYQRAELLPNTPDNAVMGASVYWERGLFQVTLAYPTGTGSIAAATRAELIRTHFKRGTTLTESGVSVNVTHTPKIHPALIDGDRYCIPISIMYQAQIST